MNEPYRMNIMQDEPAAPAAAAPTPQPAVAGVLERLVALLIDAGLIFFIYQVFLLVLLRFTSPDLQQLYWWIAGVNVPFILYETLFTSGGRNTLGRALVGVRAVRLADGGTLNLAQAFVRAMGYYVSAALLMCGFLLAFIDSQHRALQDYLAGSVVLQARQKSWGEKALLSLTGLVLLLAFGGYFYKQLFGAGSLVQQRMITRAQEHVKKIGYLEEMHRVQFGRYTNDLLRLSILSGDPVQFQRDTQAVLDRKDFRIGVSATGYKIKARAKDVRKTPVYYPSL
ncbi:RDD family protein [Candidatus Avelusimicrobium facis]|uniref:RDD family protein n=1 Tax=Candidatus Avelusimicrobium facis TaxID=3416203 RepID=UPI003D0ABA38